jgi:hypothetical protein
MQRLIDKLNREQEARDKLLKEVLETRQTQMAERGRHWARSTHAFPPLLTRFPRSTFLASFSTAYALQLEQEAAAKERERIARDVDAYQEEEAKRQGAEKEKQLQHGNALLTQAELNKRLREEEEERRESEARRIRELHEDYEQQLENELNRLAVTGAL